MGLATKVITIDRYQYLRLYLDKSIQHAAFSEVWRTTRPDGADAAHGQQRHNGFGNVWQISRDAITFFHAQLLENRSQSSSLLFYFRPAVFLQQAVLAFKQDHGLAVIAPGEDIFSIVETNTGKPFGTRHLSLR